MRAVILSILLLIVLAPQAASATAPALPHKAANATQPISVPDGAQATPAVVAVDRLTGGAVSVDELIDRFVAALAAGDTAAVEALRITEAEYRGVLIPGSVAPGEPPQVVSEQGLEYFWTEMSQKSAAHRAAILARFGGRPLTRVRYSFDKGEREFAGYKAYQRLRLVLRDEQGQEVELGTGSIVERDGVFKFASFIRD